MGMFVQLPAGLTDTAPAKVGFYSYCLVSDWWSGSSLIPLGPIHTFLAKVGHQLTLFCVSSGLKQWLPAAELTVTKDCESES